MENFTELDDYSLPPEIDLAVFGISINEQVLLEGELEPGLLSPAHELSLELRNCKISIDDYMAKMEDLLQDYQSVKPEKELV